MSNISKEKSYHYQIYHCLKEKPSFHEKLFQKEKNNGWRKLSVASLN